MRATADTQNQKVGSTRVGREGGRGGRSYKSYDAAYGLTEKKPAEANNQQKDNQKDNPQ